VFGTFFVPAYIVLFKVLPEYADKEVIMEKKRNVLKTFFSNPWVISILTSMLPTLAGYIIPKIFSPDNRIFQSIKKFFAMPFTIPVWLVLSVGLMIIISLIRYIRFIIKAKKKNERERLDRVLALF
jgi:type II secretory pathway component PulF